MRARIWIAVILLGLGWPLHQAWGQAKVGTAGAQFLEIGISARAVGMGEAVTSSVDDVSAVFYNPAGLSQIQGHEIMFTHISYFADINFDFGAVAMPFPRLGGVLGLGLFYLDAGELPVTSEQDALGSAGLTFSPTEYAFTVSYARSLTDRLSIGITGKYIGENFGEGFQNETTGGVEDFHAKGWAADVGTIYNTGFRGFKIGMMISNFGPDMNFNVGSSQNYPLPVNFRFGGSINLIQNHYHRAVVAAELAHPNDNVEKYNLGVEYWYNEKFALRVGNQFEQESFLGGVSVGGGVRLPVQNKIELRADYGYRDYGILEQAHRFSLSFVF
ncbi:MAG: PorV/PorQ family protein [candidate division Zixibacteria bacterium]|nr:PorV/PorQ family protein [candidate division Zixibacteria bacterium]